jgi:hypothetical protein
MAILSLPAYTFTLCTLQVFAALWHLCVQDGSSAAIAVFSQLLEQTQLRGLQLLCHISTNSDDAEREAQAGARFLRAVHTVKRLVTELRAHTDLGQNDALLVVLQRELTALDPVWETLGRWLQLAQESLAMTPAEESTANVTVEETSGIENSFVADGDSGADAVAQEDGARQPGSDALAENCIGRRQMCAALDGAHVIASIDERSELQQALVTASHHRMTTSLTPCCLKPKLRTMAEFQTLVERHLPILRDFVREIPTLIFDHFAFVLKNPLLMSGESCLISWMRVSSQ